MNAGGCLNGMSPMPGVVVRQGMSFAQVKRRFTSRWRDDAEDAAVHDGLGLAGVFAPDAVGLFAVVAVVDGGQ